jgi:uncharacterized protein YndB with AHSA1/START domain
MATLYHQVWIDAPVAKVYEALATAEGLGKWWAPHTSTETDTGLVFAHSPGVEHGEVKMKVLARVQNRRVEWEIISSHPKRSPAQPLRGQEHASVLKSLNERTRVVGWESVVRGHRWRCWNSATPAGMRRVSTLGSAISLGAKHC